MRKIKLFTVLMLSSFLNIFPFLSNAYASDIYVCPIGKAVGVKLYTEGLMVIDICSVTDTSGQKRTCTQLTRGDIILSANGKSVNDISALKNIIDKNPNNITLCVKRRENIKNIDITPIQTENGAALGLWLRDSTAGIGTLTYYNPSDNSFGALGHGICDIDTSMLMPLKGGFITDCTVNGAIKSNCGYVGELECTFDSENIGSVTANTQIGIYGKYEAPICGAPKMRAASIDEICEGEAYILADVDSEGVKKYSIEIKKINKNSSNGRDMVIEITDKALIEKTGGIVQGMSGAPIIQNDMFVGAVTHVFVNNPLKGYGILGENMLTQANN